MTAYATGLWFQYSHDPRIYLCPVDVESPTYTATNAGAHRAERPSSYVMNGAVCGYQNARQSCKITDVWSPDCYLLWAPDEDGLGLHNPGAFAFNDGANFPTTSEEGIERLHTLAGGDLLTVGGAVRFVSIQGFAKESNSSVKSLNW